MIKNKKVVLITGASGGFGKLLCKYFYQAGYLVVAAIRDLNKKDNLINEIQAEAPSTDRLHFVKMDVTNEDQIHTAIKEIENEYGRIDVLINNAGFAAGGFIEEVSMSTWRKQFETNVFGVIAVTKAALPLMREAKQGTIINMSSISGRLAFPGLGPYSASKFAIEGFSEALRLEMKNYGVKVILIEPGSYKTNIWASGLGAFDTPRQSPYKKQTDRLIKMVKSIEANAGDPEDVAKYILQTVEKDSPPFRHPIGKGVKATVRLKHLIPWKWIEHQVTKRLK